MPKKPPPTKEERAAARKVLQYYWPMAEKLANKIDDERSSDWSSGLETCIDLLKNDPVKTFEDYLAEYKAGNE